jgi:hypothetical protein
MADRRDVQGHRGVDGPGRQSPLLRRMGRAILGTVDEVFGAVPLPRTERT